MKNIGSIFGIIALFLFSTSSLLAVKPVKNTPVEQEATKELSEKEVKKLDKLEKKVNKRLEKWSKNADADVEVDFDDPTDKWLWYSIFSFGLGLAAILIATLVLSGFFGVLAGLLILFSFVSIIIWLVKRFG